MNDTGKLEIIRSILDNPFVNRCNSHDGKCRCLTEKEAEAAKLIALGNSWEEAMGQLKISRSALSTRLSRACDKLGVEAPKQLTKKLFELLNGLLEA